MKEGVKWIYISGPMSGIADYNFPAFNAAEEKLIQQGYYVMNPANKGVVEGWEWIDYIRYDIPELMKCDAVAVLPGWKESRGAKVEVSVAVSLGMPIYDAETMQEVKVGFDPVLTPKASVLKEAAGLVHGDRQDAYGHPYDDFSRTAMMWSAILGTGISAQQVAMCMIAVKLSRQCNQPKRDNVVDIAGYAETLQMVEDHCKPYFMQRSEEAYEGTE